VEISRAFAEHGASAIDVSSGEVVAHERPAYGRSYQTPFAERIRHAVGVPTIAVGAFRPRMTRRRLCWPAARTCGHRRAALHDPAWACTPPPNWVTPVPARIGPSITAPALPARPGRVGTGCGRG